MTDFIGLGLIARTVPIHMVRETLATLEKTSIRERALPAHVMVYYVIALGLFMNVSCREVLRCLLEGLRWLRGPAAPQPAPASKSAISQARTRLGWQVMQRLHDVIVQPIATPATKGAWYKRWRLVSLDGSTLDVADAPAIEAAFGRPGGTGESAYPQIRFVSLVENGTHVLFATRMAGYDTSEIALTHEVLAALKPGMLCLADRNFFGFAMWVKGCATGADLLWRVKKSARLPCEERLPDGSYLSTIYASRSDRRHKRDGVRVRVIEYRLEGIEGAEPLYRLVTSILDPAEAPAHELAALYHERWEIETALDELKTHLRGPSIVLRSKIPDLVRQEFFGLLMAHFAIRGLMHEAALRADEDPDRLSFLHAVRVVRRNLPAFGLFPPGAAPRAA